MFGSYFALAVACPTYFTRGSETKADENADNNAIDLIQLIVRGRPLHKQDECADKAH